MSDLTAPLTEDDFERLELLLKRSGPGAMTVDELDGFFCALVCGPSADPVSEYFPDVLGRDLDGEGSRYSLVDPEELSALLYRRWNEIAGAMLADQPYVPIFSQEEPDNPVGHNWVRGFMHAMNYDEEEWDLLTRDKHNWTFMAPVMLLLADSNPELAPELKNRVDTPEKRMEVFAATAVSLGLIFRHFHPHSVKSAAKGK